jgi:hypothetical protein
MPKILCLTSMAICVLVFLLFFFDLIGGLTGMTGIAPFRGADPMIDVVFSISAAITGIMSYFTFREQV